jgi:GPH family glycoside/pentoside/hexuronide:cation symporter
MALNSPPSLSAGFKAGYGLGQVVESVSTTLLNTFLFFYLTNLCGLSGTLAGLATFLALAVDAVADPVVGSVSDGLVSRWGRRVPVMAVSLLPIALTLALLFSIPRGTAGSTLFAYVFVLLVALRVSSSAFIIPYMGLGAELSADYDERSIVAAVRAAFGVAGNLAGYALGLGVYLNGPQGLLDRPAYSRLGWTAAAVILAAGAVASWVSLRAVPHMPVAAVSSQQLLRRLPREVREVFRNPSFRQLFGGVLLFFMGYGVALALNLHGSKYFWGLSAAQIQIIAMSNVAGLVLGLPLAFAFIGRIEKRSVVLAGIVAICLAQGLPVAAQLAGWLPDSSTVRVVLLSACALMTGMALATTTISFQSAMADAVDEHEMLFATRREGLYFASLSFAAKAASGLGSLISGLLLDVIHFPGAEIAAGATVTVAPLVQRRLGIAFGPVAALIILASLVFFARYRLTRGSHAAVRSAIRRD